jgi:hypothetical protein
MYRIIAYNNENVQQKAPCGFILCWTIVYRHGMIPPMTGISQKCSMAVLVVAALFPATLTANQMFPMLRVHGAGATSSLSYDRNGNPDQDYAAGVAYRNGFFGIVSGFISSDAVWRHQQNSVNGRLGLQAMILFFGAEMGYTARYDVRRDSIMSGGYIGIACMWPVERYMALEVSGGAAIYSRTDHSELYLRATALLNWAD